MEVDKVANMVADMDMDKVAAMVADVEVDKVADIGNLLKQLYIGIFPEHKSTKKRFRFCQVDQEQPSNV